MSPLASCFFFSCPGRENRGELRKNRQSEGGLGQMSEIFPAPLIVNYVTYFRFPVPKSRGGKKQSRRDVQDGKVGLGSDFGRVGGGERE